MRAAVPDWVLPLWAGQGVVWVPRVARARVTKRVLSLNQANADQLTLLVPTGAGGQAGGEEPK